MSSTTLPGAPPAAGGRSTMSWSLLNETREPLTLITRKSSWWMWIGCHSLDSLIRVQRSVVPSFGLASMRSGLNRLPLISKYVLLAVLLMLKTHVRALPRLVGNVGSLPLALGALIAPAAVPVTLTVARLAAGKVIVPLLPGRPWSKA